LTELAETLLTRLSGLRIPPRFAKATDHQILHHAPGALIQDLQSLNQKVK
jgi:hypothetical protein